jgi:hypothetical protein
MKLLPDMAKIKDRVKALLVKHPHLRDSDNRLIATVWRFELEKHKIDPQVLTALEFLYFYAQEQLTNSETIRRVRQKLQEENPELRGTVNEARQKEGEEVRKQI